jgi:solute carrier family 12 (potassium/chloride transporter), member 4/6
MSRSIEIQLENIEKAKYGVWGGVVVPCLQNMVGITLFVRMPWITGEAGIGLTLLILGICLSTSLITILSMNAIVTNGKVSNGGCYYLLARSLGPSLGGSVGTLYFFGQATSASLYIIGAVETFIDSTGDEIISKSTDIRFLGVVVCILLWLVNVGASGFIKNISMFCIGSLIVSLIAVYIGIFTAGSRGNMPSTITGLSKNHFSKNFGPQFDDGVEFHYLITIFYPAVIGFFSSASKSQDLKNPSTSLPKGTLIAILIASSIYLSIIVLIGSVCERTELLNNFGILFSIGWPTSYLITVGVIIITSGAALQCISSASEVLLSIARDDILPLNWCKRENVALNVTVVLTAGLVCVGSLNDVAPVITMFFLLFDGSVNVACTLLSLLNNPSWRPTWPYFHWTIALCGSLLCFMIMLYINWWAALIAFVLAAILY